VALSALADRPGTRAPRPAGRRRGACRRPVAGAGGPFRRPRGRGARLGARHRDRPAVVRRPRTAADRAEAAAPGWRLPDLRRSRPPAVPGRLLRHRPDRLDGGPRRHRPRDHAAAPDARGAAVPRGRRAHPAGLRADRDRGRPLAGCRPRLQPRHPPRAGRAVRAGGARPRSPAPARPPDRASPVPRRRPAVGLGAEEAVGRTGAGPRVADGPAPGPGLGGRVGARGRGQPHLAVALTPGPAQGAPGEALRAPPVPGVDAARHRPDRPPVRAGDGAAHRRVRHPGAEARDVPRGRPAAPVPPGLQAVLPLGRPPLHATAGAPDPPGRQLRQLPVAAATRVAARVQDFGA
jgi:hypothetical protein